MEVTKQALPNLQGVRRVDCGGLSHPVVGIAKFILSRQNLAASRSGFLRRYP